MMVWMQHLGIDVFAGNFKQSLASTGVVFDVIAYIAASLTVNLLVMTWPSKRHVTVKRLLDLAEKAAATPPTRKKRKR